MPRPRGGNSQKQANASVEVHVQGSCISIDIIDRTKPLTWLAQEVERRCNAGRQEPDPRFHVDGFHSAQGNPLDVSSLLEDLVFRNEPLHAEGSFREDTSCVQSQHGASAIARATAAFEQGNFFEAYGHNARVFDVAFSPFSSSVFASASDDGIAKIWRYSEEGGQYRQAGSFHDHTDSVMCVSWNPSGELLATGSADASVHLWQSGLSQPHQDSSLAGYGVHHVAHLQGHPEEVYAAEFLQGGPGNKMLTASTWIPYIWDVETCQQIAEGSSEPLLELSETSSQGEMPERWKAGHIFSAAQMPDGGPLVAASCSDGALRLWHLDGSHSALEPHSVSKPHRQGMGSCCAWSPSGNFVASLATDGTVALLDVRMTGKLCGVANIGRPLFSCCFLPSHRHALAVCGQGPGLSLLDTSGALQGVADITNGHRANGQQEPAPMHIPSRSKSMGQRSLLCIAASQDGEFLAASGEAVNSKSQLSSRARSRANEKDLPAHKQSRRSGVEVWQRNLIEVMRG